MITQFTCWKCGAELARVQGEQFALSAWVQCQQQGCEAMNALTYRFPEARVEVM